LFENIAAIDIGTSSIKVVAVRTGFRDFQLKSFTIEEIDQSIENPQEALKDALQRIMAHDELKGFDFITNLPMEKAIIRNITFPFHDVEKIASALPFEAEENIPYNLDSVVMDFQTLKSEKKDEGRILLVAAHKDSMYDFLRPLSDHEIKPFVMGLEANALHECYRYFNEIQDETIIQLDIGNNKTIINIVKDNSLLYTRSISIGINQIYYTFASMQSIPYHEAINLINRLHIDFTSLENNIQRGFYKSNGLSKSAFTAFYNESSKILEKLIEQIYLTINAFYLDHGQVAFTRMLISGGGSTITGIGSLLARSLEMPVVNHPFLQEYKERQIQTQFLVSFGTILSYLYKKKGVINLLKGEFLPDVVSTSRKIFYLPAAFGVLTVMIIVLKLISYLVLSSYSNEKNLQLLQNRFQTYFPKVEPGKDPIQTAQKLLKKEKKALQALNISTQEEGGAVLDLMSDIIAHFSGIQNFEMNTLVINKLVITITGTTSSSREIEQVVQLLNQDKRFEQVSKDIKAAGKIGSRFTLTLKQKAPKKTAE
jgi:type IV pilus assembly protein PilM